jgi:holo-[acyl-carrier protein] synthase
VDQLDSGSVAGPVAGSVVGIGTDLVDVERMRAIIGRRPRFVQRVFTEAEQAYCSASRDPSERYAVRFAAKEAVLKTLGVGLGGADFADIEVVRLESGQPELRVRGRAAALAAERGIDRWLVTLSHSQQLAQAFVVGLAPGPALSHESEVVNK